MNRKRKNGWKKHLDFMILDLICLEIAYILAYKIKLGSFYFFRGARIYINIDIILICIDLCYVLLRGEYKDILKRGKFIETGRVFVQNAVVWGVAMLYMFVSRQSSVFSRVVFIAGFCLSVVLMTLERVLWKKYIRGRLVRGKNLSYFLVVTTASHAKEMRETFIKRAYNGFNLLGYVITDAGPETEETADLPIVCRKEDLLEYLRTNVVDDVMINLSSEDEQTDAKKLCDILLGMGITVHVGTNFSEYDLPNAYAEQIGGYFFLTSSISPASVGKLSVKRVVDIAAGLVGSVITMIAFIFVAPAIYKASPGPIFFRQERVGKNGRKFKMFKFRSMYLDADEKKKELMEANEMDGLMFKMENDPRVIGSEKGPGKGIGNFIRKTSIDELPQFFNILKGDMSLVGTRPPTVDEFEQYDVRHKVRLSMKPGLTGLWQVSGRSEITDFEKIVKLDESYIANWSLKLDIKIIFKTFKVVFSGKGAK